LGCGDRIQMSNKFKTKWNEVDEHCPYCNNVTKDSTGLTRENIKKLIWGKPSFNDWMIFVIIVLTLFMAWAYQHDISSCQDVVNNLDDICLKYNVNLKVTELANEKLEEQYEPINFSKFQQLPDEIQER